MKKLKNIESTLYACLGAMNLRGVMEGKTTDGAIKVRDEAVEMIMKEIKELIKVQEQNHKVEIQETLHAYTDFLLKHDYLSDVDAIAEEPKAVDRFLKLPWRN